MPVSLSKGGNVSLVKADGSVLTEVLLGLGWDPRSTDGQAFDLDAAAFLVDTTGKVLSDAHFVFFNNPDSPDKNVHHHGDNLTGSGEGDDEQITIKLAALAEEVAKVVLTVTIYEAETRKQNFGQVSNAFIRVVDPKTSKEEIRYDLGEDFALETAVEFAEVYRHNGNWKIRAIGAGFNDGLAGLCRKYGVNI